MIEQAIVEQVNEIRAIVSPSWRGGRMPVRFDVTPEVGQAVWVDTGTRRIVEAPPEEPAE